MRRIELGYGMSITGELAGTVALVVYALSAGGAALGAAYAASRTVAGMGVALVLTGLTNRLRRDRLLRWITGIRMVLLAAAALLAAFAQPPAAVVAAGVASSSLAGTYRPLQAAVLPWLVRTPAELTASNAVTAVMENSGALIGPLLAGGLLAVAAPAAAMAAAAGCLAAATVSLLRLTVPDTPKRAGRGAASVARDITSGLAEFWRMAPPGGVAILAFAQTLLRGALVVLIAVLAVRVLGLGGSAVGWLNAALGAGGLAGAALAARAVRLTLLGGGLVVIALAHAVRFRRLDRAMPAPGPEAGLLYHLPMFAALPLAVTDLLAAEAEPRQFPAGAVVMREGEPGDRFYLITDGAAGVSVHGAPRPSLRRGDCFGEIALLRGIPRTATITAE